MRQTEAKRMATSINIRSGKRRGLIVGSFMALFAAQAAMAGQVISDYGRLQVSPGQIPSDRPVLVTATCRVPTEKVAPDSVVLQRIDIPTHEPIGDIAIFNDEGKDGDEVAGDGIYTAQAQITAANEENVELEAFATYSSGRYKEDGYRTNEEYVWAKKGSSLTGPWATVDGTRVRFRDMKGRTLREDNFEEDETESKAKSAEKNPKPLFVPEQVLISPDQTHIGVIGALYERNGNERNADKRTLLAREFRFHDATGQLWSRRTRLTRADDGWCGNCYFVVHNSYAMISNGGERVLLVEGDEMGNGPEVTILNRAGDVLFNEGWEKLGLASAQYFAQISSTGKYVLFEGFPPGLENGLERFVAIDVNNPSTRWIETYRWKDVHSESIVENRDGGFDVWHNNKLAYRFPR